MSTTVPASVLDAIRERVDVRRVLEERGVALKREGAAHKACCVFHAEKTPSMAVYADRFHCFGCQAHGDAIDLVQQLTGCEWRDAVEQLARDAGVEHELESADAAPSPRAPMPGPKRAARRERPERPSTPQDEVLALWAACVPVTDDEEVSTWLLARRIDAERVAGADLARALPLDTDVPGWGWTDGASWTKHGNRLVVPLRSPSGRVRSLKARNVTGTAERKLKSLTAAGSCKGLAMLDPAARQVLTPELAEERWYDDAGEKRLVVVEGEKKFLVHATLYSEAAAHAPAVVGILSGSEDVVGRVPDGWTVYIATDPDDAGCRYAERIVRLLEARWRLGDVHIELREEHELFRDESGYAVRLRPEVQCA